MPFRSLRLYFNKFELKPFKFCIFNIKDFVKVLLSICHIFKCLHKNLF